MINIKTGKIPQRACIAAFDLDHTLIKPNGTRKFPKDCNDWVLMSGAKEILKRYNDDANYRIAIFTNQSGSSFDKDKFSGKIECISRTIDIPLDVYVCVDHGIGRKPSIGMWNEMEKDNVIPINLSKSFYVGDAAGRDGDFSDCDIKFAINLVIQFYPDLRTCVIGKSMVFLVPKHPLEIIKDYPIVYPVIDPSVQELMVLVGAPASGKSTYCKTLEAEFPNYRTVCQDQLGTKVKVISTLRKMLKDGLSVIVDRKNEYLKDREEFRKIADEYGVPTRVVYFDVPRELCEHLNAFRSITTGKDVPALVYRKYYSEEKGVQLPDPSH